MAAIKTAAELAAACIDVAKNHKTLYVLGCFGAPMNATNKKRWIEREHYNYNNKPARAKAINAATAETFGFDCVNLIKGLLWGWNGDASKTYGGAKYNTNGVPDINADQMIKICSGVTTNFSSVQVGEALWCTGHIGIYIGDGLAVECTPRWKNCVQITAVGNIGKKAGYNTRTWSKRGKLPFVTYAATAPTTNKAGAYTLTQFVKDVQAACGAKVDGDPGPETISKTVTVSSKKNSRHKVVAAIQRRLYTLGYTEVGEVDGSAGPKFTSALAHFQMDNGCIVDGEATAKNKTWRKLLGME